METSPSAEIDKATKQNDSNGKKYPQSVKYSQYLQLDTLLGAQKMVSSEEDSSKAIHDEHLFIITHQAYELWFKQIIFELDSIRRMFTSAVVDERQTLLIIHRLRRIAVIMKLIVEQFEIMETMTPLDFLEFRGFLEPASGFQSYQFRILENKFGLKPECRIQYNQQHYRSVFDKVKERELIDKSAEEPSLLDLVTRWLERTPGLESSDFNFWKKYEIAVNRWIEAEFTVPAKEEQDPILHQMKTASLEKQRGIFQSVLDFDKYMEFKERGDRRLTHKAFQGALLISLYRDEPRFHQPFQILTRLMDIDSQLTKWRYNHVVMTQRMIGSKLGTGGSSGYQYLRATVSDRYRVFLDLFNLSTYLIPRDYIPPLNSRMKRTLSILHNDIPNEDLHSDGGEDSPVQPENGDNFDIVQA